MLRVRFSLFTKIIAWFFLNLLLIGLILLAFFGLNLRFRAGSGFANVFAGNIEGVTRQISNETDAKTRAERDAILQSFAEKYQGVEFYLFDNKGVQLGGRDIALPPKIFEEITRAEGGAPPPLNREANAPDAPNGEPRVIPPPSIYLRTENPTRYWFGGRTMTLEKGETEMRRTRLLAVSDSFYGHGLFFNPFPWLILIASIIGASILFWFPFVRHLTKNIEAMHRAAQQIADEDFKVRVDEKRTDELGRLGASINHLATRLEGFVGGQKRFLGDISHELNSPLARMNFALTILEDRVDDANRAYVEDVKEEVELMSKLVGELLSYSKAGIKSAAVELHKVSLKPLVEKAVAREITVEDAVVKIDVNESVTVAAQPELLMRAVGNVVRNAIRYAGNAGEISISAEKAVENQVEIKIADHGAGVPEDALTKIFDPLFRVEKHRSRDSGGSGLGLAIVKTCIEACGGKVYAENLKPEGFAVNIVLQR